MLRVLRRRLHRLAGWIAPDPTLVLRIQDDQHLLNADRSPDAAGDQGHTLRSPVATMATRKKQPRRDDGHQPRAMVDKLQIRIAQSLIRPGLPRSRTSANASTDCRTGRLESDIRTEDDIRSDRLSTTPNRLAAGTAAPMANGPDRRRDRGGQ